MGRGGAAYPNDNGSPPRIGDALRRVYLEPEVRLHELRSRIGAAETIPQSWQLIRLRRTYLVENQHVRHEPPLQSRPWVTTREGRASQLGAELWCVRCVEDEDGRGSVKSDSRN